MKRWAVLAYGVVSYVLFLGVFLYLMGFVGNFAVPLTMDATAEATNPLPAVGIDLLLVALFGLQHSVMARGPFKRWITKYLPEPMERSTYVLTTNAVLILMFWQWRPVGIFVWDVEQPWLRIGLYTLFATGWLTVLATTFLINHFDLFGLRQPWLYFRGKPYTELKFKIPGVYQFVRHPLYVGWLMAFWATPTMTVTHLAFAVGMTAYILVAIVYEERDLVRRFGSVYESYRESVPMLIPRLHLRQKSPHPFPNPPKSGSREQFRPESGTEYSRKPSKI